MKPHLFLLAIVISGFAYGQNNPPKIQAFDMSAVFDQSVCMTITTTDIDNDVINIWLMFNMTDAVFTNNSNTTRASASLCVVPKRSVHQYNTPYGMRVYATDGKDTVSKEVSITIWNMPEANPVIKKLPGNTFKIDVLGDTTKPWNTYKGLAYTSRIYDAANKLMYTDTNRVFTFTPPDLREYTLYVQYGIFLPYYYNSKNILQKGLTTSVKETNPASIQVYPNPAAEFLTFKLPVKNVAKITITDIAGKLIAEYAVSRTEETLDVSKLSPGIYFLTAISKNGTISGTQKFIKQ